MDRYQAEKVLKNNRTVLKIFTFTEKKEIFKIEDDTKKRAVRRKQECERKECQKLKSAYLYNAAFHQGRKDDMTGFPEMEARRGAFPRALGIRGIPPFCAHLENN